ncbi:GrpB family protein [Ferrimonas lipolytica]|uniref:GrpB protein n=1 Tax=Ferrimonas lipolytica TaxID=2724191 RepID=A0A6H1UBQ1_9GAMM|nr:GrpB family protein [Ferrimonas lipolytica]QIZ75636.1 hypothetical protein HER31_01200 [Ferrimonas lipolytica]
MDVITLYECHQYQPEAQRLFNAYQAKLRPLFPSATIEHVGSSAIDGAISKGNVDIFLGVPKHQLETAIELVAANDFTIKTDTLRSDELCMLQSNQDQQVAVLLVANDSKFEFFLHFRDQLNRSPDLVAQYNQVKRNSTSPSERYYYTQKSLFIVNVLDSEPS